MNTTGRNLTMPTIAAAVTIATAFFTIGFNLGQQHNKPINEAQYKMEWIGTWDTNTEVYQNLRIIFHEEDNQIIGLYHHPSSNNTFIDGTIVTKIDKYSITGEWTEMNEGKKIDGHIKLLLCPNNKSFVGSYTRSWEKNKKQYVWNGLKAIN